MARIIYKAGYKGQNHLECIEGIEIELLNGQKALIYPKYAERPLLKSVQISKWDARIETEIGALRLENTAHKTEQLFALGSRAAKWVNQFCSDKHGVFNLPSLLAAMVIQQQQEEIDALAKTIEGADLLRNFTGYVWSCSRGSENLGWIAYGYFGFAGSNGLSNSFNSNLSVPVVLYR